MITPEYCRMMARYNEWQNKGLRRVVEAMPAEELDRDRGAFFGSIRATLNHLLWADLVWLQRFGLSVEVPKTADRGVDATPSIAEWGRLRFLTDGRIREWALGLNSIDLTGDLEWTNTSGVANSEKRWVCVTHFFNHQTHHRGQVHAMLTAAGQNLPDTDIAYLPKDS